MLRRIAVLLAVLALVTAACGGDDSGSQVASLSGTTDATTAADEATEGVDQEAALIALTECLRDNGMDISDPTVDADGNVQLGQPNNFEPGVGRGQFREAFEACQEHLEGAALRFARVDQTELQDTLYEYAACMRDHGYDMPDPDVGNFGPGGDGDESEGGGPRQGGPFGVVDFDDPVFQAAQESCQDILAGFGPGGRGPGGGGGNESGQNG